MLRIVAAASLLATAATMQLSAAQFRRAQASTDPTDDLLGDLFGDIDGIMKDATTVDGSQFTLTTVNGIQQLTAVKGPPKDFSAEIIEEYPELGAPVPAEDMSSLSGPEATDADNAACEDIHGKYVNFQGHEVTVYQDGCSIKAAFWLNKVTGGVIKSGTVVGDKVHLREFNGEGTVDETGTITFGDGLFWKLEDGTDSSVNSSDSENSSVNSSENASVNSTDVADSSVNSSANASLVSDACKDISGHYKSKAGKLVTVTQTGCAVSVLLSMSATRPLEVLEGTVDDIFVNFKVLGPGAAHLVGEDSTIDFVYGPGWKKMDDTALESITKDTCSDLSGSYAVYSGKLVTVKQVGCHAEVTTFDGDTKESMTKLGSVVGEDLQMFNFAVTKPGHRDGKTGALDFGNGMRWGKLGSTLVDDAYKGFSQDNCTNLNGNYRAGVSGLSMVRQRGCHVQIQHFFNSEEGDITVQGYVFGSVVHAKGFSMGKVDGKSGVHWAEYKDQDWVKLSSDQSTELGIPEAGCTNFGGLYSDMDRKPVIIKQNECKLQVKFYLGTTETNVTRTGYVSADTVHLQNFIHNGFLVAGNIMFGNITAWEKVNEVMVANTTDCGDFHGLYLDQLGNSVLVSQTGCDLQVTFWAESLNTNLTKSGHVENQTVHIQDFQAEGERTDAGISFGQAQWFLADDGNPLFSDDNTEEDNGTALLQTGNMLQNQELKRDDDDESANEPGSLDGEEARLAFMDSVAELDDTAEDAGAGQVAEESFDALERPDLQGTLQEAARLFRPQARGQYDELDEVKVEQSDEDRLFKPQAQGQYDNVDVAPAV